MKKYEYDYPRPAVATDCVVFGFDGRSLKVLLIERGVDPFRGMWAFPGGFMRMDETAEECAVRELKEETGLSLTNVRQLGAFTSLYRDPRERIVSIAFYALARQSEVVGGDDAAKARWWPIDEVPQLAFDHDFILRQAMLRIRQDIHFEPVGFGLLEECFTIADLQRLYESILGVRFDRRNFYNKILKSGILQEADEGWDDQDSSSSVSDCDEVVFAVGSCNKGVVEGEMAKRDFDDLFCVSSMPKQSEESVSFSMVADDACVCGEEIGHVRKVGQVKVGRKGKLFRFDEKRYECLKKEGGFRLEF